MIGSLMLACKSSTSDNAVVLAISNVLKLRLGGKITSRSTVPALRSITGLVFANTVLEDWYCFRDGNFSARMGNILGLCSRLLKCDGAIVWANTTQILPPPRISPRSRR
jgi:hypothetical protein